MMTPLWNSYLVNAFIHLQKDEGYKKLVFTGAHFFIKLDM